MKVNNINVEIPAPILYYIKEVENNKNPQYKYEYLCKLKVIYDYIGRILKKYEVEFPNIAK